MRGKHTVTVHGAPRGRKAYIQWRAAWFHKGIVNGIAVNTLPMGDADLRFYVTTVQDG